jgi:hypothetical protein
MIFDLGIKVSDTGEEPVENILSVFYETISFFNFSSEVM